MKKVMILCLLIVGTAVYAQRPEHKKDGPRKEMKEKMEAFTPQQRAELKTKRMTLQLDLTSIQQTEIQKLNLRVETTREERKATMKKSTELTSNERFERATQRLDDKIEIKNQLKSILTAEQFEKFEKTHRSKNKGRKGRLGRKKR